MSEAVDKSIGPDDPLRLEDALALAYPAGGMTLSGLRREIHRGTLEVELTAGKHFTTLRAIKEMRRACRDRARDHIFGSDLNGSTSAQESSSLAAPGSSSTPGSITPQDALRVKLALRRERSRPTSPTSTALPAKSAT